MQSYEQLSGGEGRRIFYRAERFSAKSLFGNFLPKTEIGHIPHRLTDLSISGLAAINRSEKAELTVGAEVPVDLRINNMPLHQGKGRIVRAEPTFAGTKVAVNFLDGFLDVPALVAAHREQSLRQRLKEEFGISNEVLDPQYRLMCADFLHTVRRYKGMLESWAEENSNAAGNENLSAEMVALCEEHFKERWREFQREANKLIEEAYGRPGAIEAMKHFTESVVTPELLDGPIWNRSYEKPLGYPGDHIVMDYVYTWKNEGDTLAGKFSHRLGLDALECVATRMAMMQDIIAREIHNAPGDEPVGISNLACGTAQEIVNTLAQRPFDKKVTISLIDQDERALAHAYEHAYPHSFKHGDKVGIQCFHSSFTELMKGGALTNNLPQQNLIYSVGLFDYLREKRAKSLTRSLYQYVKPGGLLVIGNLKRSVDSGLWAGEMICDWTMYYRSEQEMRDMAEGLNYEKLEVLTDRTNRIYMLCVRKPLNAD